MEQVNKEDRTQLLSARSGEITPQMHAVAEAEQVDPVWVRDELAAGRLVIPQNCRRQFPPVGIGRGLRTKVNANIGTSLSHQDLAEELTKLRACVEAGAHACMDLSTGRELKKTRHAILDASPLMVGTVPIYGVGATLQRDERSIVDMRADELFEEIELQCADGVDFITVHCGVTLRVLELLQQSPRVAGIVSRGGSLLARWMGHHKRENPLYEEFDRLVAICRKYDVTLSLGDGLRPGSIIDATDGAQLEELQSLAYLATRAQDAGVQVMIEGPGHVPLDQIATNMHLQKRLCNGAPFYVLGPLPTDIGAGYDHISGAIGGALAAMHGADFLCYVTAAEHLRLPTVEEVREGVVATRLAAHAADVVKLGEKVWRQDRAVSEARRRLDWDGMFAQLLDPVMARHKRHHSEDANRDVCSMCGDLCAIRTFEEYTNNT